MNLQDIVALITGAGSGVGRATALTLAAQGCHVALAYAHSKRGAEEAAHEAGQHGVRAVAFQADVTDDGACRKLVAQPVATLGRLDVLINCAGTTEFIPAADLDAVTDDVWDRLFKTNVVGAFHCARAARGAMLK